MNPIYVSINGTHILKESASLNIEDLSIQRGFGIFDFLKTINGKAVFLEDYLDRFFHSIEEMKMDVSFDRASLKSQVFALMESNQMPNSGIKIILTGGYAEDGYTSTNPNLLIVQSPFTANHQNISSGWKLITYNHQRQLPNVKTIDYLQAIRLQNYIQENGAQDVLYHNNGQLCECPRANFFAVIGNKIISPKSNILAGITRKKILSFQIDNYTIEEQDLTLEDLSHASEAFITSTTKNIQPVIAIDDLLLNQGKIGPVTSQLHQILIEKIADFVN